MKKFKNLLMIASFAFVLCGSIYAETISKSFEFGAGTENSISAKRTFQVPCGQKVSAVVMFQRGGGSGVPNIDLVMELRSPGETADEEGPIIAGKEVSAKVISQTAVLEGQKSNRGCSLPWVVRVKPKSPPAPVKIFGTISVVFQSNPITIDASAVGRLEKGDSKTVTIGSSSGLQQGIIRIAPIWFDSLMTTPIKMKIELLNPNGDVVASDTGYSNVEFNPCCSDDKVKIEFTIPNCVTGQWKVRLTNLSERVATRFDGVGGRLTPDCP